MLDFRPLLTAEGLVSVVSLTALEIVLGIDNIVFIAIVSERLEPERRPLLRRLGVGLALGLRLGLLLTLSFLMGFTRTLVNVLGQGLSGRDLILLAGGLFLIAKSSHELFRSAESSSDGAGAGGGDRPVTAPAPKEDAPEDAKGPVRARFSLLLAQILVLDVVFSLDSVITAVGMARQIVIMAVAMVTAVLVMLLAANVVSDFITRHPSMKVLALSFLMMIGVLLIADAFDKHISKGYVYFAMVYALAIELINIRRGRRAVAQSQPPPPKEEGAKPHPAE